MPNPRRKGRTVALQVLYELDCTDHDWLPSLTRANSEAQLTGHAERLAREIVEGVTGNLERLDAIIQEYAPAWPVSQLSVVGRNILRIAIFEIVVNNSTPHKAAVNEAVELAKLFGSENLHKFINGVLGSVMATART